MNKPSLAERLNTIESRLDRIETVMNDNDIADAFMPLVRDLLAHPHKHEWSLQGFGMLRHYLTPEWRLHLWSHAHSVENVSIVHDHPWHFTSFVLSGSVVNRQYQLAVPTAAGAADFLTQSIKCGAGGCELSEPRSVHLVEHSVETLSTGHVYRQRATAIHSSHPIDGAVTLVHRTPLADPDSANVFWPAGESWVSAEPRAATIDEINDITKLCLANW